MMCVVRSCMLHGSETWSLKRECMYVCWYVDNGGPSGVRCK